MFLGSRARPVRRVDNLATICESVVYSLDNRQFVFTARLPTQGGSRQLRLLQGYLLREVLDS
jgi:hypothetical protein